MSEADPRCDWWMSRRKSIPCMQKGWKSAMAPRWKCQLCIFATALLKSLVLHVCNKHGTDSNFRFNCCVDYCPQTFSKSNSFYKHVQRHHSRQLEAEQSNAQFTEFNGAELLVEHGGVTSVEDVNNDDDGIQAQESDQDTQPCDSRRAAAFILRLKSECKLSQKSTGKVVAGMQAFTSVAQQNLKRKFHATFRERGSQFSCQDIDNVFEEDTDPFEDFKNEYSILKYIKKNFNYVEPVEHILGKKTVPAGHGQKRRLVEKKDRFYYIPVVDTLRQLMSNQRFCEEISKDHASKCEKMEDYCDSTNYRNHAFFARHPAALQILLYYDDVEVCNPLGSKSKIHKVGLFYFTIANIHPKYRSRLSGINLLAICLSRYLTKEEYGIDAVLQPFVQEMLQFEHGVEISANRQSTLVHGVVVGVIADTLAAHAMAGFKEGVGFAYRKCRHCMISSDDMSSLFRPEMFVDRTPAGHAAMCDKLENAESVELRDIYSATYGINRRSILEKLPYFSVTNNIPQDLMHIFLEGCLPYTLKQVIKYFVQQTHSFSISQLNDWIENFEYGYVDMTNKPTLLSSTVLDDEGVIRQSSSQMWTLGRFLPLLIEEHIDLNSRVWQCYLLLLQIMCISFSPIIQEEDLTTLDELTEYYLTLFKECFDVSIRPKHHYLCHLSQQIHTFGPLVRFWCMRYEAKHAYFKSLCSSAGFKNISLHLAQKHQLNAANNLVDIYGQDKPHPCFDSETNCGPSVLLTDQAYALRELRRCNLSVETSQTGPKIYESKWVEVHGNLFKPGCFVVIEFKNGLPIFAEVQSIWTFSKNMLLRSVVFRNVGFKDDLNAFQIEQPTLACSLETISVDMLKVPDVYCAYTGKEGNIFIVPKTDLRMFASYDN